METPNKIIPKPGENETYGGDKEKPKTEENPEIEKEIKPAQNPNPATHPEKEKMPPEHPNEQPPKITKTPVSSPLDTSDTD